LWQAAALGLMDRVAGYVTWLHGKGARSAEQLGGC
jgi:hypothetical protein